MTQILDLYPVYQTTEFVYFLPNKLSVSFVEHNPTIEIKNYKLGVRPFISKHKKVIISNVCPVIPHDVIEKELIDRGITISTKISFIKVGISEPGFSHIMSFRRQVYIAPEHIQKLPTSTIIYYDNISYRIFFTTDNISYFICKDNGHIANQCPLKPINNNETEEDNTHSPTQNSTADNTSSSHQSDNQHQAPLINNLQFPPLQKRSYPTDSSSQDSHTLMKTDKIEHQKAQPTKKKKPEKNEPLKTQDITQNKKVEEQITPIKSIVDNN